MNPRFPIFAVTTLLVSYPLACQAQDSGTAAKRAAYQSGLSEDRLLESTRRLRQDLDKLVGEYASLPSASTEIALLQESIATLEDMTTGDIPATVELLLSASRADDLTAVDRFLTQASNRQGDIQLGFRKLADKLAQHAGEAAMRKRIETLAIRQAANLQSTRNLAEQTAGAGDEMPRRTREALERRAEEQKAIKAEIALATDALRQLSTNPEQPVAGNIAAALTAAETARPEEHAAAAAAAMTSEPAQSVQSQEQALDGLQEMMAALESGASPGELERELATELANLAHQEQALANQTPTLDRGDVAEARQKQEDIAARLEVMQDQLERLSPDAGAQAADALAEALAAAAAMESADFAAGSAQVAATADAQQALAAQLAAMSEAMHQQADQLAGLGEMEMAMSPEEMAIFAAMKHLQQTLTDIEITRRQNRENLDYQTRLAQADANLDLARDLISEIGLSPVQEAVAEIGKAEDRMQIAASGKDVEHELFHARTPVNKALSLLQEAAQQLAEQAAAAAEAGMGEGGEGVEGDFGMGLGESAPGQGGPMRSALAEATEARREAISALSRENVPTGYEAQVDRYLKSLGEE